MLCIDTEQQHLQEPVESPHRCGGVPQRKSSASSRTREGNLWSM